MSVTSSQINKLLAEQIDEWPRASINYAALANVKVKSFGVGPLTLKVQFNPARIVSSAAKVDAKSLAERKCFLCHDNRPAVQRGIDWGERYTILINPFPIFPRHLTIPDKSHTLQLIKGRIADMLTLAGELDEYTIFYNGPRCGASAPDHMHFQAGNSDFLTIAPALESCEMQEVAAEGEARLYLAAGMPMGVFVIDADTPERGQMLFDRLYAAMPIPDGEAEPMMNLLAYSTPIGVRLAVIPRKRHRPSFYGTEGPGTMLISPASVDMGGVFITPLEKDFDNLDINIATKIFDELCLSPDEMAAIAAAVK